MVLSRNRSRDGSFIEGGFGEADGKRLELRGRGLCCQGNYRRRIDASAEECAHWNIRNQMGCDRVSKLTFNPPGQAFGTQFWVLHRKIPVRACAETPAPPMQ